MSDFQKLQLEDGNYLAYVKKNSNSGNKVVVIFLSGYASDMEGTKATELEKICQDLGLGFIRFDYSGTGKSSGEFLDGTITKWQNDTQNIIDHLTDKDQKIILIGSSMGGWIMLLTALRLIDQERADKLHSLIGIASAPDFTEDLMWDKFSKDEQDLIINQGYYKMPTDYCDDPEDGEDNHYIVTKNLILDGRENRLLNNNSLSNIKVRASLLHGMKDADVPFEYSIKIADRISSENVEVRLQKNAQHRFSEAENIGLIRETLEKHLS
jgi:pimeloyl-ACP methyl ester carboxylesterase